MNYRVLDVLHEPGREPTTIKSYGPYPSHADATARAVTLAAEYDEPGDTSDRYNGKDDWWGRNHGDSAKHTFDIIPAA